MKTFIWGLGHSSNRVILKHKDLFKVVGFSLGNTNQDKHIHMIETLNPEILILIT